MLSVQSFRITGLSPLLLHNPAGSMEAQAGGVKKAKVIPLPDEEAKRGLYVQDGKLYLPSIAFRRSLIAAGSGKKIGKMSAIKVLSAGVFTINPVCFLHNPKTLKPLAITDYTVHIVRVCMGSMGRKVAVMRGRPEIQKWGTDLDLEIDSDFIMPEQVLELFNLAGRMIGVGDWRVACGGSHGRYTVALVDK